MKKNFKIRVYLK